MLRARGTLLTHTPYEIERTLRKLGQDLRTARLRRGVSLQQLAENIGVSREVLGDAEKGKPSTGIAVYASLLWTFGMLQHLEQVATPTSDIEGMRLESFRGPKIARSSRVDDDF